MTIPGLPRDRVAYIAIPLGIVAYHVATSRGYGIFRDELYYLSCANHLDWGYVDHPPLSILLLAIVRALVGDSLRAIRLPAALAGAGTALLTASVARAFGGGAFAQRLGALAAGLAPIVMALSGFYSMNAFDLVFWTAGLRIAASILAGGNPRLWLAFGAVAGLGLENKISVLFLGLGLACGIVAARRWELLRERWLWLGGAVALALFLPHLVWQAAHDWPTLEFMQNARRYKLAPTTPWSFVGEMVVNAGPLASPIWVLGLGFLLAGRAGRPWRAIGWAFLAILLVMITTGAKPYYLAAGFPVLFAAGGVAWERWTGRWIRVALSMLVVAGAALAAPLTKGLLPVESFIRYAKALGLTPSSGERQTVGRLPQHFADMHGWRELAETVAKVRDQLPLVSCPNGSWIKS